MYVYIYVYKLLVLSSVVYTADTPSAANHFYLNRENSIQNIHETFVKRNRRGYDPRIENLIFYTLVQTEKSFQNLIKSTRNQIVFIISQLFWNQTEVLLFPNQSENGKYNLISG